MPLLDLKLTANASKTSGENRFMKRFLLYLCITAIVTTIGLVACSRDRSTDSMTSNMAAGKVSVLSSTDSPVAGSTEFCALTVSSPSALAKPVGNSGNPNFTVFNTDFVSAGVGGMRNNYTGTIALSGVTGPVSQALLYWHGPTNSTVDAGNLITLNGNG